MCSVLKDRERERDYWLTRHRIDCMEKKKKEGGKVWNTLAEDFHREPVSRMDLSDSPRLV